MKPARMLAMLLTALVILYPLSVGPVAKIYYAHHSIEQPAPQGLMDFYAPLAWLCHNSQINDAFGWYLRLWIGEKLEK